MSDATAMPLVPLGSEELVDESRKFATEAVGTLVEIMRGTPQLSETVTKDGAVITVKVAVPPQTRLAAAEALLNRGFGRAPQALLIQHTRTNPMKKVLPLEERIKALRERVESSLPTTVTEAITPPESADCI